MAVEIEIVVPSATVVQVQQQVTDVAVQTDGGISMVVVENGASQQNLFVQDVNPGLSGPGIWIETGLGSNGEDYTIWIEDGA